MTSRGSIPFRRVTSAATRPAATTSEQKRAYEGPALLSYGFRPFFLFGAIWGALSVALWLPFLAGAITIPTAMTPVGWHAHELIFGFVPAIVAGFLLTAVPNWTGRLPVVGTPLLALVTLWVAGRLAVSTSQWLGASLAAIVDLAFLAALAITIAREIVASGNMRNLKVLVAVGLLFAGNGVFHLEAMGVLATNLGERIGVAAIVVLIMLIGGRIIPSFTRNWLSRQEPGRLPVAFDRTDAAVVAVSVAALAGWIVVPQSPVTAALAVAAFMANVVRLGRWAGERTFAEPLVVILHVGFAFVPIGFLLVALAILFPASVAPTGALHGWTAGAIGLMTLAVMTRASLGHTGQPLLATRAVQLIYVAAVVAALARIAASFGILREPLLYLAALGWVLAFGGFAVVYAPLLTRRR